MAGSKRDSRKKFNQADHTISFLSGKTKAEEEAAAISTMADADVADDGTKEREKPTIKVATKQLNVYLTQGLKEDLEGFRLAKCTNVPDCWYLEKLSHEID